MSRLSRKDANRLKLSQQVGRVDCQVSERWLQFPRAGSELQSGTFLTVDVMTRNVDGQERKLCELVLIKEELQYILDHIETK